MREIVVGVDAEHRAQRALRWALLEGAAHCAVVRVVAAWRPPAPFVPFTRVDSEPDLQQVKRQLERAIDRALERTPGATRDVVPELVEGFAQHVLVDSSSGADLLVVGTRGGGTLDRLVLGSVSHSCVMHANVPIAVVPGRASLDLRRGVTVGIDGSPGSELALEWAIAEAAARESALTVVNGWWVDHPHSPHDYPFGPIDSKLFMRKSTQLLQDATFAARSRVHARPPIIELVPSARSGAAALVERSRDTGLLVVGSRGHSGLASFFLGSVAQRCVRESKCAVVVVPQHRVRRSHAHHTTGR